MSESESLERRVLEVLELAGFEAAFVDAWDDDGFGPSIRIDVWEEQ